MRIYTEHFDAGDFDSDGRESVIDLRVVIKTLWRGKWILVACVTVALALSYVVIVLRTDSFYSAAHVLIDPEANEVIDIRSALGNRAVNESVVGSQIHVISSNRVLARVVEELELASSPVFVPALKEEDEGLSLDNALRFVAQLLEPYLGDIALAANESEQVVDQQVLAEHHHRIAIAVLSGELTVRQIGSSYVVEVGVTAEDPQLAALLANAVADAYIELERQEKLNAATSAARWLAEQLAKLEGQVQSSADAVDAFRIETGLTDEGKIDQVSQQVDRLRRSLVQARETRIQLEDDFFRVGSGIEEGSAQEVDLTGLKLQLDAAIQREQTLAESVRRAEAQFAELVRWQAQLEQLERQAAADRSLYERFLEEMKEVDALGTLQLADARIIADALPPFQPSGPSTKLVVAFAVVFGAGLGVAIIALRELLRTTIRSREELQSFTRLPVLARLPRVGGARNPVRVLAKLRKNPTGELAESIRTIRANLTSRRSEAESVVVMVTSASANEGKSTLALMLAYSALCANTRALLIDCDLRQSRLATVLKLRPATVLKLRPVADIAAVLAGHAAARDAIAVDRAFQIPVLGASRRKGSLAPEYLESERFGEIIDELRADYDLIIIDTPPLGPVTDAAMLGRHVDAVLFCVRWGKTSRALLADALGTLRSFGTGGISLVLTMVNRADEASYRSVPRKIDKNYHASPA